MVEVVGGVVEDAVDCAGRLAGGVVKGAFDCVDVL